MSLALWILQQKSNQESCTIFATKAPETSPGVEAEADLLGLWMTHIDLDALSGMERSCCAPFKVVCHAGSTFPMSRCTLPCVSSWWSPSVSALSIFGHPLILWIICRGGWVESCPISTGILLSMQGGEARDVNTFNSSRCWKQLRRRSSCFRPYRNFETSVEYGNSAN